MEKFLLNLDFTNSNTSASDEKYCISLISLLWSLVLSINCVTKLPHAFLFIKSFLRLDCCSILIPSSRSRDINFVARYLTLSGIRTTAILNITDIDPKISLRAKEEMSSAADISNRFINELLIDIQSLGISTLSIARTSDYIETARKLTLGLLSKKRAYSASGNVYLDTSSIVSYGKLSQMSLEDLVNNRVDIAPGKKNPNDILLWNGSDDFGQSYYDEYLGVD